MRHTGRQFGHGYGQGYGSGYGRGWYYNWREAARSPEGFKYLGPCRCGFGPHAYWQEEKTGRIFRGFPGYETGPVPGPGWLNRKPSSEKLKSELNWLKQEKEEMEDRIRDLEEKLKQKEQGTP